MLLKFVIGMLDHWQWRKKDESVEEDKGMKRKIELLYHSALLFVSEVLKLEGHWIIVHHKVFIKCNLKVKFCLYILRNIM